MDRRRGLVSMYVIAAVVVISLICLAIVARNWSCRHHRDPRPPRVTTIGPLDVIAVDNGATIRVKDGRSRKPKERTVTLAQIEAPEAGSKWADISRDRLKALAGDKITVQVSGRRVRSGAQDGQLGGEAVDKEAELEAMEVAAHGPLAGIVFGASGINLNKAMIEAGLARCSADAPADWNDAQNAARKSKIGIWSK